MKSKQNSYYIITIGCQMNMSDSERLAKYLEDCGYTLADEREKAGLVIVNTCGVRQSAEDRVYSLIPRLKRDNPRVRVVLTGCLSLRPDVRERLKDFVDIWMTIGEYSIFNTQHPINIQCSIFNTRGFKREGYGNYLSNLPKYNSKMSAFVPIGNGCDNFCSYCVVPYARGRETWRPASEILAEVRELADRGYKEITLIAQNVNSYISECRRPKAELGSKKNINFSDLLKMINDIEGNFWVRFVTSHPKDMSTELIRTIAKCEKVCEYVHLPVQAGDDAVLKAMNRKYTAARYLKLVQKIKEAFSRKYKVESIKSNSGRFNAWLLSVAISTDVIVGFPGETKAQFNNTVRLFRKVKFDQAFISRYSPRPGTAAAKMEDDVPKAEKMRREKVLTGVLRKTALANNKKYAGKIVEILVEGKNRRGEWQGRTRTNKMVTVKTDNPLKKGEFVSIKITEVRDFGLTGTPVRTE